MIKTLIEANYEVSMPIEYNKYTYSSCPIRGRFKFSDGTEYDDNEIEIRLATEDDLYVEELKEILRRS